MRSCYRFIVHVRTEYDNTLNGVRLFEIFVYVHVCVCIYIYIYEMFLIVSKLVDILGPPEASWNTFYSRCRQFNVVFIEVHED